MAKTKSVRPPFVVGGVDTHKDLHVAAVVDENNRVLGSDFFATTRQGYRQMLTWMASFGTVARIGVEMYRFLRRWLATPPAKCRHHRAGSDCSG